MKTNHDIPHLKPLLKLCLPEFLPDVREDVHFLGSFQNQIPPFLEKHRLHALLLRALENYAGSQSLERLMPALHDYSKTILEVNRIYLEILSEILQGLSPGTDILLLKGADLILRLYEDERLRPLDDIDILVLPNDVKKVEAALMEIGFSESGTRQERYHHKMLKRKSYSRLNHALQVPFFVEVHWDFRWSFHRYATEQLWQRAQMTWFQGRAIKGLDSADNFLYLGLHWINHWRDKDRLLWACDLAWLIKRGFVNWQQVKERAKNLGLVPVLWAVIVRLQQIWEARVLGIPEDLQKMEAGFFRGMLLKCLKNSPYWLSLATWNSFPASIFEIADGLRRTLKRERQMFPINGSQ